MMICIVLNGVKKANTVKKLARTSVPINSVENGCILESCNISLFLRKIDRNGIAENKLKMEINDQTSKQTSILLLKLMNHAVVG